MATIGSLAISGTAQLEQFDAGLDKARGHVLGLGAAFEGVRSTLAGGFLTGLGISAATSAIHTLTGALGGVAGLIGSTIMAGSELNETLNKTKVVLGDAAGDVIAFANVAAKELALVKAETLDAASGFGGLLKNLAGLKGKELSALSIRLTKLAADVSSIGNRDFKEVTDAFRIALSGEQSDFLKQLGVVMLDDQVKAYAFAHGIAEVGSKLTEAQKVAARTAILFEKLGFANNDLKNTLLEVANASRGFEGRLKNLQADVGMALGDIAKSLLGGLSTALEGLSAEFSKNQSSIQEWARNAVRYGGVVNETIGVTGIAIAAAADATQDFTAVLAGLSSVVADLGANLVLGVGMIAVLYDAATSFTGLGKTGLGDSLVDWAKGLNEFANEAGKLKDDLDNAPHKSEAILKFFQQIKDGAIAAVKGLKAADAAALAPVAAAGGADPVGAAAKKLTDELRQQIEVYGLSARAVKLYELAQKGASDEQLADVGILAAQLEVLDQQKKAYDDLKSAAKNTFEHTLTPVEKLGDALLKLQDQFRAGLIDKETLIRGVQQAQAASNLFKGGPVAALETGSAEAYSARLASLREIQGAIDARGRAEQMADRIAQGTGTDHDAAQMTAKNTQMLIEQIRILTDVIRQAQRGQPGPPVPVAIN